MRKFHGRSGARTLCAGFAATAAAAAAVVAGTALPAYAVNQNLTVVPSTGGLTGTIEATYNGFMSGVATPVGLFSTSACSTYPVSAPSASMIPTITKKNGGDDTAVITLPSGISFTAAGAGQRYYLCMYAAATSGSALIGNGTYDTTFSTSNTGGPQGGNVVVTSTGTFANMNTVGAYFVPTGTACAANYTTSGVTAASSIGRTSDDQITVGVPAALALNSNAFKMYNLCVYNGTTGTATLQIASTYQVAPAATSLSPNSGASGGGNTVTATFPTTSPIFNTVQTYYGGFATGGCPSNYANLPAARKSATVTRISGTQASIVVPSGVGGANNQAFNACFYSAASGDFLIGTSSLTSYSTTIASSALSSTVGAGSNVTVNLTSTNTNAFANTSVPYAVFFAQNGTTQYCPGSYTVTGGTAAQGARKASSSKVSVQFPVTALDAGAYTACVYSSNDATTSKLTALASYTVAPVPMVKTVSPPTGPALGGNTVTVTGTNLPTNAANITVTIGNVPVAASKVTAGDNTYFQFVAPAHSNGAVDIVVKTDVGTTTLVGGYTYVNSISLATTTAPNTNNMVTLDVYGAGFLSYNFVSTANAGAHVYLVRGRYDGSLHPAFPTATATPKERSNVDIVADCTGVWVVDDSELLCSLDLTRTLTSIGTQAPLSGYHTESIVGTGGSLIITAGTVAAGSTAGVPAFTQADVGKTVAATASKISAGTYITKVIDGYTAAINQVPIGTFSATSIAIGFQDTARLVTAATTGATTLTAASGAAPFDANYVGRLILETTGNGDSIPNGTYITGVNSAGTTITLSQPITGDVASTEITSSNAVRSGSYNVLIVGDAAPGSATPNVSAISSGSTFTVANF